MEVATAGSWSDLEPPLQPEVLSLLEETMGFSQMTPVQAATLPQLLHHRDVVVEACTGSGKTLAFLVPMAEILLRMDAPPRTGCVASIILSPTRELALQTYRVCEEFRGVLPGFTMQRLVGADDDKSDPTSSGNSVKTLAHIIVATPGRLRHVLLGGRGGGDAARKLASCEMLIMDEADRLLDLGFAEQLKDILNLLPKQRRTGLFSATQTESVKDIIRSGLRNPVKVNVNVIGAGGETGLGQQVQMIPASLKNYYLVSKADEKLHDFALFLLRHRRCKTIAYVLTCAVADYLGRILASFPKLKKKIDVFVLHGKMEQKKRVKTYASFRAASHGVLLATDVAARGLDNPDVDWVVQFDAPQDPDDFVHRVGRTARMGREGKALVMLRDHEDAYVPFLADRHTPVEPLPACDLPASHPEADNHATGMSFTMQDLMKHAHEEAKGDRLIFTKSHLAMVSYVRGYQEHQCKLIFNKAKIDYADLARMFALIAMPRMPETKGKHIDFTPPYPDLDVNSITFKDANAQKQYEKKRDEKAAQAKARAAKPKKEAWSEQKAAREEKLARKEKRIRKRKWQETQQLSKKEKEDDWNELQNEARLLKKLRKGQITEKEYLALTGGDDDPMDELSDI